MSANRLGGAASAYLRSAAHQPIHWYPWGAEAFAEARSGDRPVLLDIGAVWCHWCHVMDGESYEDAALAAFLNENFVCVKVDRDERPDVDARYQRAVQMLTGQGGWPLTAFLVPSGDVFYGGTYFPPDGRLGRPGFRTVLASVLEAYRARRDQVVTQAAAIRRAVDAGLDESMAGTPTSGLLDRAEAQMARAFDPAHGGFGSAPKFPHPAALVFLLHRWSDAPTPERRTIIDRTLQGMARGGMHDHLGGGFHRYSVDREWIVPHFEKMSYDNSELLRIYADAAAAFGDAEYAAVARGIVRWVREVLADPAGGYGASQDADVGLHDDGDYFTWTRDEAAAELAPAEFEVASAYYDIGTAGEMHHNPGKNVLFIASTVSAIAAGGGRTEGETRALLASAEAKLRLGRARRAAPFVDRSRYSAWNAMMASALLRAAAALEDGWAWSHALLTLTRLRSESAAADTIAHASGGVTGLLDDQVHVAAAALDAFEATGDASWLDWAERLMHRVWADYWDDQAGGLFDIARGREGEGLLPARAKPVQDAPTPSANGTAGIVAVRLAALTDASLWAERARALLDAFGGRAEDLGLHGATLLLAADWAMNPATHFVVTGPARSEAAGRMHRRALATYVPRRVVRRVVPGDARPLPAAIAGMLGLAGDEPRGFLCTGTECRAPADEAAWSDLLDDLLAGPRGGIDSPRAASDSRA